MSDDLVPVAWAALLAVATIWFLVLTRAPRREAFPQARGRDLDNLANVYGHKRKRWLWVFRERDATFRKRVTDAVRDWPKGRR